MDKAWSRPSAPADVSAPHRQWPFAAAAAAVAVLLAVPLAAFAADHDHDHDRARDLFEHGAIRALADILPVVHAAAPGQVIAVDLIQLGKAWVYRFQVLAADSARSTIDIDAATAGIIPPSAPGAGAGAAGSGAGSGR